MILASASKSIPPGPKGVCLYQICLCRVSAVLRMTLAFELCALVQGICHSGAEVGIYTGVLSNRTR
jgi:hypothetical protein